LRAFLGGFMAGQESSASQVRKADRVAVLGFYLFLMMLGSLVVPLIYEIKSGVDRPIFLGLVLACWGTKFIESRLLRRALEVGAKPTAQS